MTLRVDGIHDQIAVVCISASAGEAESDSALIDWR
jgi:hypothetical protein